ncbi:hypothetical protein ABZ078_11060 [Streptomyces sp. NPDC006385]|uniref:hypothetical protein n=1 Tax=Streptomyces sp. NPDC006385 TaxID=3156761 RepID=UPI0033A648CA
MSVIVLVLVGVLLLVVGGCVCVVWASRGGPRWVRGVAAVTLAVSEMVGSSRRKGWGSGSGSGSNSGSDD